jgi:arsenite-transporting ATPase
MQLIIVTGAGGSVTALVAAATALAAAPRRRTLLASIGPAHALPALLGATPTPQPQQLAPGLDAVAYDALAAAGDAWNSRRAEVGGAAAQINGDELPLLPGMDALLALDGLRSHAPHYDLVVLDFGGYVELVRALAVPDGFRWFVRLLVGLDRGPGRSAQSAARAMLPAALLPPAWLGPLQDARVQLEALRDVASTPSGASAAYVLDPSDAGLAEARVAIPALQLHGLAVAALVAGPLLPPDTTDDRLAALAAAQARVREEAAATWPSHPLLALPLGAESGPEALRNLGQRLYGDAPPEQVLAAKPPIRLVEGPALALNLPGLPRGQLKLTLSGDELIVAAGPFRRHILLPEALRGTSAIKATREGDDVLIRVRP